MYLLYVVLNLPIIFRVLQKLVNIRKQFEIIQF